METRVLIPPSLSLITIAPSSQRTSNFRKSRHPARKVYQSEKNQPQEQTLPSSGQAETAGLVDVDESSYDVDKHIDIDSNSKGSSDRDRGARGSSEEETETDILKSSSSSSSDSETNSEIESKITKSSKNFETGRSATATDLKNKRNSFPPNSVVTLCAKEFIDKGTVLRPNDGEIRILFLEAVPNVSTDDIRFIFGCFDRKTEDPMDEDKEIRLCNWVRFIKLGHLKPSDKGDDDDLNSSDPLNKNRVNMIGRFVDGKPQFEFIERVASGTEIVAFFDIESITLTQSPNLSTNRSKHNQIQTDLLLEKNRNGLDHFQTFIKIKNEEVDGDSPDSDGPLDLSKSPTLQKSKLPSIKIKTEPPFDSPDSQKGYQYFETASKSQPFSITNVLQSAKIFQPYSLSSPCRGGNESQESNFSPSTLTYNSHLNVNSFQAKNRNGIPVTSLATPNSMRSSPSSDSPGGPSPLSLLQQHTNPPVLIRPILRTRGRERSLLPCEVCGKAFDRPSLLKRHMRTHTGEKPHVCDVCSKGFSTSSSLNTHRRIHSGEKPHQCPICGKRFTASSNLYYHRMTHNKEKPHKCSLCGKSFPTPGDLKSHQYVHSGSWPYNCPICHRGFSKQTNLRNHLLLHSGDKPHNCHICGKKFALACNLRAHLRTHEEEPISSCSSCKRSFLTSLNMLVNGYCRTCLLTSGNKPHSSSEASVGNNAASRRSCTPTSSAPVVSLASHSIIPTTLTSVPGFHLPGPPPGTSVNPTMFPGGSISTGTNPFLEQLFEWNYRFAKETAGNLSIMQQKLLESQMLAAQLMIGSSNPPAFGMGITELLRLRPQDFNGMDLNKFIQQ